MYYYQPFHNWIIGIIIASVIILLVLGFFRVRRRQQVVSITNYATRPTPSRVESGFNRNCKNVIQQSHIRRYNDIMIQLSLMPHLCIHQDLQRTHQVCTL